MNKLIQSSLLTVVLAVALYFGFTIYSGSDAVLSAFIALSWQLWLSILALSLLNYLLRYWRWHGYIKQAGNIRISHAHHLAIYLSGFALTMTPGKAGEAMRSLYLKQQGVDHQRTLAALFVERIMDLLAMLILAVFGLSLLEADQGNLAALFAAFLVIVCILAVKLPWQYILEQDWFKQLPQKPQELGRFLANLLENANALLSTKHFIAGLSIGLLAWGVEGYGLYLVMQDYQGAVFSLQHLANGVAVYSLAVLLGAIAFLPGGLGGTEAAMVFMLNKLGFDIASATAITLICRIATLWFAVILGMIVMFILSCLGMKPVISEEANI